MTIAPDSTLPPGSGALVPPAPVDVTQLRVTQAQLARFIGVSRQTTSQWAKRGLVTFAAHDGRANLGEAIRQIVERADPKRLRVRAFRDLVHDQDALRQRVAELEAALARAASARAAAVDEAIAKAEAQRDAQVDRLLEALVARFDELASARARGALSGAVDLLLDDVFYAESPPRADAADAEENIPPQPQENHDDEPHV